MSAVVSARERRANLLTTGAFYLAVATASVAICIHAVALNLLYYANHGPFYDSMVYLNHLAALMGQARSSGLQSALHSAWNSSTVVLPWLEGILLAPFFEPSRPLGVWLQAPWVLSLSLAAALYFRNHSNYSYFVAGSFAVALVAFNGIFFFDGGLSDFRMDLLQALTFGAATALYLTARSGRRLWIWAGFGVLLSAACLARATTPVYAVLVFGGFAFIDMIFGPQRIYLLKRYLLAASIVTVSCSSFYISNFRHLYYYYFVWNTDAIARLPLSSSMQHAVVVMQQHIGMPMMVLAVAVFAFICIGRVADGSIRPSDFNWRALWAGLAPVGYLVASGAGLNPFVSMVSVPGVMLFMLSPLRSARPIDPRYSWLLGALTLVAVLLTAAGGARHHTESLPGRMGLDRLTDRLLQGAEGEKGALSFQSMYIGAVDSPTISNVLTFDRGFFLDPRQCAAKGELALYPIVGGYAQPLEWSNLPGATAAEKIEAIVNSALTNSDLLIVPEPSSKLAPHVPINPHAFEVRRLLLEKAGVESVGDPITLTEHESVRVYRNNTRSNVVRSPRCS